MQQTHLTREQKSSTFVIRETRTDSQKKTLCTKLHKSRFLMKEVKKMNEQMDPAAVQDDGQQKRPNHRQVKK